MSVRATDIPIITRFKLVATTTILLLVCCTRGEHESSTSSQNSDSTQQVEYWDGEGLLRDIEMRPHLRPALEQLKPGTSVSAVLASVGRPNMCGWLTIGQEHTLDRYAIRGSNACCSEHPAEGCCWAYQLAPFGNPKAVYFLIFEAESLIRTHYDDAGGVIFDN